MPDRRHGSGLVNECFHDRLAFFFATLVVEYHGFDRSAADASGIVRFVESKPHGLCHFSPQGAPMPLKGRPTPILSGLSVVARLLVLSMFILMFSRGQGFAV